MLTTLLIISCILFYLAYKFYGNFLVKRCGLDDRIETPACRLQDGVDYVPTRTSVLFGHHFSSIAGAGPIVGPILAGIYFGWGPTWLWIILGAIFVGGVHDFGSSFMSVRSRGKSIAETMRKNIGEGTGRLFMIFVILALIYVIVVFLDLTAVTFSSKSEVATASGWFIITALAFGIVLSHTRLSLRSSVIIFVPITFLGLLIGHIFPAPSIAKESWIWLILAYCYIAAVLPVQILLQPRDFLSSSFLYAMLGLGIIGLMVANAPINLVFYKQWDSAKAGMLVPFLFITVACGACSGFHSIVASGTTSKQIRVETDIRRVSFGAMLVEGVLATFALGCVAVLSATQINDTNTPTALFAKGAGFLIGSLGIPAKLGEEFSLLAVSTFLLTTLDTCTRLTRFLIEELLSWRNVASRYLGTLAVLLLPGILVFKSFDGVPAWKAIWPLFGSTNQLLAALALVSFIVFLKARRARFGFVLIPAAFMVFMPLVALFLMLINDELVTFLRVIALFMFILGLFVVTMSAKFVVKPLKNNMSEATRS